jgi:hypothetical protein
VELTLNAIHELDSEVLLQHLGFGEELEAGLLECDQCCKAVTLSTLFAIFPESGQVHVVCDSPACVRQFLSTHQVLQRPSVG